MKTCKQSGSDAYVVVAAKHDNHSCEVDNGLCAHSCMTLYSGGYVCHCREGYRISPNDYKSCSGQLLNYAFQITLDLLHLSCHSQ